MQLNGGWLVEARRVPSPHYDSRPDNETPSLLVVHNISLPPGEFGGPWIDALFSGTLDPNAHPFFAEIAHLRVSAHCLIRRDGEIVQYVLLISVPGTRAFPATAAENVATTFPSALSWKGPIRWPIPTRSISNWLRLPVSLSCFIRR